MISSASTLLLVTLVFNAASVFGAPVRIPDAASEVVARAELSTPVQPVARAAIVDVEDHRRRSELGTVSRRSARLITERDEPFSDIVVTREPDPSPNRTRHLCEGDHSDHHQGHRPRYPRRRSCLCPNRRHSLWTV
ncbi:hypothetical protein GALMADRAFT_1269358 [Galerina marginata CBS 339.88]|uniref:Secreted protein n=1 Tax=Galerina marginata (strain CBS 339.88) TaxID=685588 RepID=A0A067T6G9_GALM3|nr:hypothetical protein GALMADRAFT_1269358 [Galerina marginata CBS 339.88]